MQKTENIRYGKETLVGWFMVRECHDGKDQIYTWKSCKSRAMLLFGRVQTSLALLYKTGIDNPSTNSGRISYSFERLNSFDCWWGLHTKPRRNTNNGRKRERDKKLNRLGLFSRRWLICLEQSSIKFAGKIILQRLAELTTHKTLRWG